MNRRTRKLLKDQGCGGCGGPKVRRLRRSSETARFPRCGGSAAVVEWTPHTPYSPCGRFGSAARYWKRPFCRRNQSVGGGWYWLRSSLFPSLSGPGTATIPEAVRIRSVPRRIVPDSLNDRASDAWGAARRHRGPRRGRWPQEAQAVAHSLAGAGKWPRARPTLCCCHIRDIFAAGRSTHSARQSVACPSPNIAGGARTGHFDHHHETL